MCLEFLCSWCHKEEDGPEPPRQNHHTSLPPAAKPPINGTEYPARGESPSKPRSERSGNDSDTYLGRHDSPPKRRSEMPSNGTDTLKGVVYPARQDPPLKLHLEPYNANKNQVVSGVAVNRGTKPKAENPKTSSMVFNGEKDLKAVHPRPLAPQIANNTVSAAPVPQPNPRIGAQRNGHMRKDEEEEEEEDDDDDDDDDEEEEEAKAGQTKNRRY